MVPSAVPLAACTHLAHIRVLLVLLLNFGDNVARGNGCGLSHQLPPLLMLGVEAEKTSVLAQPTDQERQDSSTVPGFAEEHVAEVKVANLQGAEQEVVRLVIQAPIEGRLQEVKFEFNLDNDRPKQVLRR